MNLYHFQIYDWYHLQHLLERLNFSRILQLCTVQKVCILGPSVEITNNFIATHRLGKKHGFRLGVQRHTLGIAHFSHLIHDISFDEHPLCKDIFFSNFIFFMLAWNDKKFNTSVSFRILLLSSTVSTFPVSTH